MSKKEGNDEKRSDIDEKRSKLKKIGTNSIFCDFTGKYGKMSKKVFKENLENFRQSEK